MQALLHALELPTELRDQVAREPWVAVQQVRQGSRLDLHDRGRRQCLGEEHVCAGGDEWRKSEALAALHEVHADLAAQAILEK